MARKLLPQKGEGARLVDGVRILGSRRTWRKKEKPMEFSGFVAFLFCLPTRLRTAGGASEAQEQNGVAPFEGKGYVRKGMEMASPITTAPGKTVGVNQPPMGVTTVSSKRGSKRDGRRKEGYVAMKTST